jgi:hypothetical protein
MVTLYYINFLYILLIDYYYLTKDSVSLTIKWKSSFVSDFSLSLN